MLIICLTSANEVTMETAPDILESCIAKIAQNDSEALADLYRRTSSAIYAYALSVLKNTHDAEDVLHDCCLNVYSAAETYTPCGKPMAWIFTIARNLCLLKIRSRKRTEDIPQEDWESHIEAQESISQDDKLVLLECMKSLTDEERQIVTLHATAGFKHREIADMLDIPLATVLSKYNRALKKLKEKLTKGEKQ